MIPSMSKKSPEMAEIFRRYIGDYQKSYKLHPDHYKVVGDILECRTPFLGGHIHVCNDCDSTAHVYNSCGNRHCPKCQTMAKARWLEARKAELLPVPYFHSVFTLPHSINPLALCNKKVVYALLFKSVSETLLTFGENPKNGMGGKLGVIGILHTWNQQLMDHIHLHFLVPGGVLSPDKTAFKTCPETFLFPVKALSEVFRGKFMEGLKEAFDKKTLIFPGQAARFESPKGFRTLVSELWSTPWVVYSKPPFSGPETVLEYMARYTHRVAISNNRIISCENGRVTFSYKNRKKDRIEELTLDAVEFIRRFLLHVVPPNFMRIRHFGLFANRCKKKNIALCRALLGVTTPQGKTAKKSIEDIMLSLTGEDIKRCPVCQKGIMIKRFEIPKYLHGTGSFEIIRPQYRRNTS
ncbi:MAG: IS91 family transposase [Proteobacteria bacterium]|nr:IS91 family transposase [Pseudomonadota bacterium]